MLAVDSTPGHVVKIKNYVEAASGNTLVYLENSIPGCDAIWLDENSAGAKNALSILLSAQVAVKNVIVGALVDNKWPVDVTLPYCKMVSVSIE